MGDPARAILFRAIATEIQRNQLVKHTAKTGKYLYFELEKLAKKYPDQMKNLRGKDMGTFIAWDSPNRDEFLRTMKFAGVNIGGSGDYAVRLRPMLIFANSHGKFHVRFYDNVKIIN